MSAAAYDTEPTPIEQIMADLEICRPANQHLFIPYPRTRDDFECAEAERRAEQRRGEHG